MISDLTSDFWRANSIRDEWNEDYVREVLQYISGSVFRSAVDWDDGDEQWGRVLDSRELVLAFVCVPCPIVISLTTIRRLFRGDKNWPIVAVFVEDMSTRCYSVERLVLESIFGRQLSDKVDYESISIEEIWWSTVI